VFAKLSDKAIDMLMNHIFLLSQRFGAKCRNKLLGDLSVNFRVFLSSNTRFIFTNLLEIGLSKNLPILDSASIYGYMRDRQCVSES
jgi:hypothetical protein